MNTRIIPRLDLKGPDLVKGVNLEGLRVLGKPEEFAQAYYESGADELLYMDTVASLYGKNRSLEIIERTSKNIFIPLTVGGGLRNLEDIKLALRAGADKVAINTAAVRRPEFISEASEAFGASTIVVSIEAMRAKNGTYEALTESGREKTGVDALEWAKRAEKLGAGELLVTSIMQEGTGKGFDCELVAQIAQSTRIPVIAAGGAGKVEHVWKVLAQGHADAVCVGSLLHYGLLRQRPDQPSESNNQGNTVFLKSGHLSYIKGASLPAIKKFLTQQGIACRLMG